MTISQPNYLYSVLSKFQMENCNPVGSPMEQGSKFSKLTKDEKPFKEIRLYQRAIGCSMYAATTTRPDLAYSIGILARYMSEPSETHWS